jgi:predicted enzyme related to lactoylglutathione lyase
VIHFEISADDPARASEFYKCVFSWRIEKWGGRSIIGLSAPMIATKQALTGRFDNA